LPCERNLKLTGTFTGIGNTLNGSGIHSAITG